LAAARTNGAALGDDVIDIPSDHPLARRLRIGMLERSFHCASSLLISISRRRRGSSVIRCLIRLHLCGQCPHHFFVVGDNFSYFAFSSCFFTLIVCSFLLVTA